MTPDVKGGEEMDDFFDGDTPRKGFGGGSSSDDDDSSTDGRGGGGNRDWDSDGGGDGGKVQVRWQDDSDDDSDDDSQRKSYSSEEDDDPLPTVSKDDPFFGSGTSKSAPTNVTILGAASAVDLDPGAIAASFGAPESAPEYETVGDDVDALEKEFAGDGVRFSDSDGSEDMSSRRKKKEKKSKKSKKEKKEKKEAKGAAKDWDESD